MGKRIGKVALLALTIVLIEGSVFAYSHRPKTVQTFFRLERKWNEHWRFQRGKDAIRGLEPFLRGIGVLRPVRVQRGFSLLLDPYRAAVPASVVVKGPGEVDFSLDRVWSASECGRELGLIVTAVGLESK